MTETVNHPAHYQGAAIETRHILEALGVSPEYLDRECIEVIECHSDIDSFHLGNAVKYLWRCGQKGDRVSDLQKARWYLQRNRGYRWSCELDTYERQITDSAIFLIDQLLTLLTEP